MWLGFPQFRRQDWEGQFMKEETKVKQPTEEMRGRWKRNHTSATLWNSSDQAIMRKKEKSRLEPKCGPLFLLKTFIRLATDAHDKVKILGTSHVLGSMNSITEGSKLSHCYQGGTRNVTAVPAPQLHTHNDLRIRSGLQSSRWSEFCPKTQWTGWENRIIEFSFRPAGRAWWVRKHHEALKK